MVPIEKQDSPVTDPRSVLGIAGISMAVAVATGAFGAHALEDILTVERLQTWQTAVSYQFWNTLGLFALAMISRQFDWPLKGPIIAIITGIVLFSGSLYTLCLTDIGWFGAVTPFGGVAFITGWVWFALIAFKKQPA
jgi:uncharacterized membrane protein YgdD (TMEM256/DUF423 family)